MKQVEIKHSTTGMQGIKETERDIASYTYTLWINGNQTMCDCCLFSNFGPCEQNIPINLNDIINQKFKLLAQIIL